MSVTAPSGFVASGITAGLKTSGTQDLALVVNRGPRANAAAVFTSNRCKANPVLWSEQAISDGQASAIILNSGGANCYTGAFGFQTSHLTAEAVGAALDLSAGDVLVCSTGLIGVGDQRFRDRIVDAVPAAAAALADTGGHDAALAIMTTDTRPKLAEFQSESGWMIGGMAKGAGMLAPGLATMLVVITTDADLESRELDTALRAATRVTFDRLDSDGCMSTNDTVALMASGASAVRPDLEEFADALAEVCLDLTLQLQADAEGASHDITIIVTNAETEADAVEVARAVSRSNLFKAAIFGNDPNWGRILAAAGTTAAAFDPFDLDVTINGVMVCRAGEPYEDPQKVNFAPRAVGVTIDLKSGDAVATLWTNDLTHEYVHENSAYSS